MADNFAVTAGSGTTIGTEAVGSGSAHVQQVKTVLGNLDANIADLSGRDVGGGHGAAYVDVRPVRKVLTPTAQPVVTAAAYSTPGMAIGGLLTFTGATRVNGGSCLVRQAVVGDKSGTLTGFFLVLFGITPSAGGTDHVLWSPSDADALLISNVLEGWATAIVLGGRHITNQPGGGPFPLVAGGATTSIFAQLVAGSSAPTFASTSDVTVSLIVDQD